MPNNIISLERESFRKRLANLAGNTTVDDDVFADIIYETITKFGISQDDFRDTFGLSKSAVERWMLRQNLPQSNIRPKIILWIKETLA